MRFEDALICSSLVWQLWFLVESGSVVGRVTKEWRWAEPSPSATAVGLGRKLIYVLFVKVNIYHLSSMKNDID